MIEHFDDGFVITWVLNWNVPVFCSGVSEFIISKILSIIKWIWDRTFLNGQFDIGPCIMANRPSSSADSRSPISCSFFSSCRSSPIHYPSISRLVRIRKIWGTFLGGLKGRRNQLVLVFLVWIWDNSKCRYMTGIRACWRYFEFLWGYELQFLDKTEKDSHLRHNHTIVYHFRDRGIGGGHIVRYESKKFWNWFTQF